LFGAAGLSVVSQERLRGEDAAQVAPSRLDVEAAAAAVEAELDAQEWNMQEIERIQDEQVCLFSSSPY
jgi:hypothetical protein